MGNMFRCTLASGGALVLTVTCDSAFAGETITCTDGTTTLTQICPSTSPYTVEFRIPNAGIWTISSGTTSTSVTIPSSAELHDIPNGSTITPTDDIQIWLQCANIWDKAYTTISQVLTDSTTLFALIASSNAVDYMVRSTTWASDVCADSSAMIKIGNNNYCADTLLADSTWRTAICNSTYFESVLNVKVPTMTSATTPSGQVIASTNITSHPAWHAFDGIAGSDAAIGYVWDSTSNGSHWIGYRFTENVTIYKYYVYFYTATEQRKYDATITWQGSNDNTNWDDIDSFTLSTSSSRPDKYTRISLTTNNYLYYRLYFNKAKGGHADYYHTQIYILQFYGRKNV